VKCERDNCPEETLTIPSIDLAHKTSLSTGSSLHKYEILGNEMAHHVSHQMTWTEITNKLPAIKNDYDVAVERKHVCTDARVYFSFFVIFHSPVNQKFISSRRNYGIKI